MSNISFDYVDKLEIDVDDVIEAVKKVCNPEEVFDNVDLHIWAVDNGYVKEKT